MTIERDGLFDISVTKILKEGLLEPETIFQCLLAIPGTQFQRREETMYFPGKGEQLGSLTNVLVHNNEYGPEQKLMPISVFGILYYPSPALVSRSS